MEIVKRRPIINIPKVLSFSSSQQLSEDQVIEVIAQWAEPLVGRRPTNDTSGYWIAVLGFFAAQVLPCFGHARRQAGKRKEASAGGGLSPKDGDWFVQEMDLLLQQQLKAGEPLNYEKAAKDLKKRADARLSVKRKASTMVNLYYAERRARYQRGSITDFGLDAPLLMKKRRKRRKANTTKKDD